ncbi:MAG: translation initiation factor IF-1A [Desulfurococcales archaeon]|jgi:translation initiation factor 1A|uniref:Translation initiation factor 1A n=1 Tax=Fervidicoccus fontis TaxID=683846 RepID=A0A7J3SMB0_9CREN|nr:translation initiation factor IF-1A [Thermoprotei archaeon]NAY90261.1 translation initiation factor IF-1A [Desulfurococcales archaeon]
MVRKEEGQSGEMPLPGEGMVVCVVEKILGGDHFVAKCADGVRRMTRIPGRLRRRMWIREGDVVLVAPWEMEADKKGDLIYKYSSSEVRKLAQKNLVPPDLLEGV